MITVTLKSMKGEGKTKRPFSKNLSLKDPEVRELKALLSDYCLSFNTPFKQPPSWATNLLNAVSEVET